MELPSAKLRGVYEGRITEQYITTQVNYHYDTESFRDWKDRNQDGDKLYRGDLAGLFPSDSTIPNIPLIENKYKNALHDISRLASEGRGMVKALARGAKADDMKAAEVFEAINEGYWRFNKMTGRERQLYLDLSGTGVMEVAVYYNDRSPYPQLHRLDPRFSYPDVRDGKLQSLLQAEVVKERVIANQFPHLDLDNAADNSKEVLFVCLYEADEVVEAVLRQSKDGWEDAKVTKRWPHELGVVPVGFEKLDTFDGAFHGLLEQLAGPLMVRNKLVRFVVDEAEQIAHAPIRAKNVINADDEPGPNVIYQIDPTADDWVFDRLPPATTGSALWQMLGYMQDQEEKEAVQPPARSGNVSQSIASGSFVDRTQGQLTSVVKELQDKMASLREQVNEVCMRVDEKFLNHEKPLYRPIANKKTYVPTKAIDGWYFHEVKFGAGAGLDRINADSRLQNWLAARVVSREEVRHEIDFLENSASSQDKIDRENAADALFQRLVRDVNTPLSVIARLTQAMFAQGSTLVDALGQIMPELLKAEEAAQRAANGGSPPSMEPPGQAPAPAETPEVRLPFPSVQQLFGPGAR